MSKLQEHIVRAAQELGLRVEAPFEVQLEDGSRLEVLALLPELGGPSGTLVSTSNVFTHIDDQLERLGYGFSVMSEESEDDYDLEGWMEVFADWEWAAKGPMPDWMKGLEVKNATVSFQDAATGADATAVVSFNDKRVTLSLSLESDGNIEVYMSRDDVRRLIDALRESLG